MNEQERVCKRCGVSKPPTLEYWHRNGHKGYVWSGGLATVCKVCRNAENSVKRYLARQERTGAVVQAPVVVQLPIVEPEPTHEPIDTEGLLYDTQEPLRRPATVKRGERGVWGWIPRMEAMSSRKAGLYGYRLLGHGTGRKEEEAA